MRLAARRQGIARPAEPASASASVTSALLVARIPNTRPLVPDRNSSVVGSTVGDHVSRIRPATCAPITIPYAQRRLTVCQPQPASVRSSARRVGIVPFRTSLRLPALPIAYAARASARTVASERVRRCSSPGVRQVPDPAAVGQVAQFPLLLVPVAADPLLEQPDALERAPSNRHVRPPGPVRVDVTGSEVQRRDRGRLVTARPRASALEPRANRASEDVVLRRRTRSAQDCLEPPGRGLDVIVDEHDQLPARRLHPGVPRGVGPAGLWPRHELHPVPLRDRCGRGIRAVAHDDHLGPLRLGLRHDRTQRDVEVLRTLPRGDHDRRDGGLGHTGIVAARARDCGPNGLRARA